MIPDPLVLRSVLLITVNYLMQTATHSNLYQFPHLGSTAHREDEFHTVKRRDRAQRLFPCVSGSSTDRHPAQAGVGKDAPEE